MLAYHSHFFAVREYLRTTLHSRSVVRIIIMVIFSIIGCILIHFFEKPVIICATSLAGAYITVLGVDMVLNVGLAYDYQAGTSPGQDSLGEVGAVIGLAVVGAIWQAWRSEGTFGGARRAQKQQVEPLAGRPYGKYP